MDGCIFCKIIRGEIPADKIEESDNFIVISDASPVSKGHCLVIPTKHFETAFDMPDELSSELLEVAKRNGKRLLDSDLADGIKFVNNNYDASGQVVKHFHLHIIPEKLNVKIEKHV